MKYHPISCDYYDELTLLAMRHTICPIIYQNEKGARLTINASIKDIYTRGDGEFLLLSNGEEIRLDRLVSVDGKPLPDNSCK